MSNSLSPEDLAWLRQCAAVDGNTYDRLLLHLLERVAALEAAQQQPHQDKLDRLIALDRDDEAPTPKAAPVATLSDALIKAECALSDIAEGEETNAAPNTFVWAEQRCAEALAIIRPVMQQHGIRTSGYPPAAQPAHAIPLPQAGEVPPVSESKMAAYNHKAADRFAILDRLEKAIDFNSYDWRLTPEGEQWQQLMAEQEQDEHEMGV
jgi:hypothetical protein